MVALQPPVGECHRVVIDGAIIPASRHAGFFYEWNSLTSFVVHLSPTPPCVALAQRYAYFCSGGVYCGVRDGCIVEVVRSVYWLITHFVICSY